MVATISQIIGKVSPILYAENGSELLKKYGSIDKIPAEEVKPQAIKYIPHSTNPKFFTKEGLEAMHTIDYDSSSEVIEPIYFFVLDLMDNFGLKVEKLVDNFSSTPGSSHFSETGIKASRIQDEAMKIMGSANAVLRSILNIIYDLRDFQTRLEHYDSYKSKNESTKDASRLALKQIWMDKVDIAKGNSSIKAMALGQAGFQTLIDAFLIAKDADDVDKLDLNDRVKRILKPRVFEFNIWLEKSEKELRKRYEIEKTYLKSQVNSLKLYSRWVKPYLKAAQQLEMKNSDREPSLVNMFNTLRLELTLFGKSKIDVKKLSASGDFPKEFEDEKFLKTLKRNYNSCILVDFTFRAIPRQGNFVGRSQMTFRAYALNDDELKKLDKEIDKSDLGDMLSLIEGATTESLGQLQEDIDYFLKEPSREEKGNETKDDSNPFTALIGGYNKKEKKEEKKTSAEKKEIIIPPDSWIEKEHIRKYTANSAKETCFSLFDVYKKAHGMPSYT
jgi:hypothetical protein